MLRSFEEFLFELLSWIIYYPLTLWRVITRPLQTVSYSDEEQRDSAAERYTDTLSPPLFLLVTIILVHAFELATDAPAIQAKTAAARLITASDENLVLIRSFLFGMLPLFAAWRHVSARKLALDRKHLRPVFYGHCYPAGAFALTLSLSIAVSRLSFPESHLAAGLAVLISIGWYLIVQTLLFRRSLHTGTARAAWLAARAFVEAVLVVLLIAALISGMPSELAHQS